MARMVGNDIGGITIGLGDMAESLITTYFLLFYWPVLLFLSQLGQGKETSNAFDWRYRAELCGNTCSSKLSRNSRWTLTVKCRFKKKVHRINNKPQLIVMHLIIIDWLLQMSKYMLSLTCHLSHWLVCLYPFHLINRIWKWLLCFASLLIS